MITIRKMPTGGMPTTAGSMLVIPFHSQTTITPIIWDSGHYA